MSLYKIPVEDFEYGGVLRKKTMRAAVFEGEGVLKVKQTVESSLLHFDPNRTEEFFLGD